MKIAIIGSGYVGLTTAAFLSTLGHHVVCVDKDQHKINQLKNGKIPIYEPGLETIIEKHKNRLNFTLDLKEAVSKSSVIMVTVGTPSLTDGSTDLSYIDAVLKELGECIATKKTIVIKSTVPPGTNERLREELLRNGLKEQLFQIVSNPEFLREGSAVYDMFHPDRTVIGLVEGDSYSLSVMKEVYKGYEDTLIVTSLNGAEMIKYASNSFLATKISFINELARICDSYQVDVTEVAKGMGLDHRIGHHFLQSGIGYGGSCFPKDVSSLYHSAKINNVEVPILKAIQTVNQSQVDYFLQKITTYLPVSSKIGVLGIAFKPNTDDIRYSKAVNLIEKLSDVGYSITTHDPKACLPYSSSNVLQMPTLVETIKQTDAIIIATEWDEYINLDWNEIKNQMKGKLIFDGRNCLQQAKVEQSGLKYIGIGRG